MFCCFCCFKSEQAKAVKKLIKIGASVMQPKDIMRCIQLLDELEIEENGEKGLTKTERLENLYQIQSKFKVIDNKIVFNEMVGIMEQLINTHDLPLFVQIFKPQQARQDFTSKIAPHFSDGVLKVFTTVESFFKHCSIPTHIALFKFV